MIDWIKTKWVELKNAVKEAREINRSAAKFWKLADELKRMQQIDKAMEPEWVHQAKYFEAGVLLCQCFQHDFLPSGLCLNMQDELYFRWHGKNGRHLFVFFADSHRTEFELHWTERDSFGETQYKMESISINNIVVRFNDVQISNLKEFLQ